MATLRPGSYALTVTEEERPVDDATARPAGPARSPAPVATDLDRLGLWARRREGMLGLFLGLVVAVALHVLLFPAVGVLDVRPADSRGARKSAQLIKLSRADLEKNRRIELEVRSPAADRAREPKVDNEDEAVAPGQVVSLPPPEKAERPDVADYAAEHDQRTDHETRSRDQSQEAKVVTRERQQGQLGQSEPRPSSPAGPNEPRLPANTASTASGPAGPGRAASGDSGTDATDGRGERMFALEMPRQAAREPLRLRLDDDGTLRNREAVPEVAGDGDEARVAIGNRPSDSARLPGSGGSGDEVGQGLVGGGDDTLGPPSLDRLTPGPQELARMAGAPANDFLPEVEVDAATRLNAWRWKHATFFNRIADAIRREWQGGEVLTSNDPAGHVYGFEDRMTVLQVTLDKGGNVVDVNVAEPSGAMVLDDEAVRAFKEAGPFSNPPAQLFKGSERFTFLFGFNVSYNRTNIDLRWRPD